MTYDGMGNLLSETDNLGLKLTYSYTARDQVASVSRNSGGTKSFSYDANSNLTEETDWKGVATSHGYDGLNRRIATTDRLGHTMSMAYDKNGNLISQTDFNGNVTEFAYDDLNRLTDTWQPALPGGERGHLVRSYYNEADEKTNLKTITDQEGNTTSFVYNGRYLKTGQTDPENHVNSWSYDDAGNLESETDERNIVTTYAYDKQNRLLSFSRSGISVGYQYDAAGNRTKVTDGRGNSTIKDYDSWNRPYRVTDALGKSTVSELDGAGNPVKTVDANNVARTRQYDKRGLVAKAVDGEGRATSFTYDLNGNVETVTNPRGLVTSTSYDAEDRLLTVTEAAGTPLARTSEIVSRDNNGNPLIEKDWGGKATTTEYNVLNLPARVTDALNHAATTAYYYRTGKPKTITDRRGHATSYEYDGLGRQTRVTDAKGQTIVTSYDGLGNVETVTDKRDIVTENFYDDYNRLIGSKRVGITLVQNEYDEAGNLTATVDAENNRTEMGYDKLNRLVSTKFADGSSTARTYDNLTNVLTSTDEEGKVTGNSYDKENRLVTVSLAGETTTNEYDELGKLVSVARPAGNMRVMEYDLLGRLTSVTDDAGSASLLTRYEYDANGNLRHQYDPLNNQVEYLYDGLNRKTGHIQHKSGGNLTTTMGYDEEGNLTSLTDAKGQTFTYAYDKLNRRTTAVYPAAATPYLTIRGIETGYDANNNVMTVTETKDQAGGGTVADSTVNTYDDFDRLKTTIERGLTIGYNYDNNGNRTGVESPNGSTAYTFDNRNRLATALADGKTTSYTYTTDGKQKAIAYPNGTSVEYGYQPSNRVETVTNKAGGTTISSYAYQYDPNGNRTQQIEVQGVSNETTVYSYNGLDQMTGFTVNGEKTTVTTYTFEAYNRKTETVSENGITTKNRSYSYDETDWLTTIVDNGPDSHTIAYSYDNNGNTLSKSDSAKPDEELSFIYDSRNQLVRTTRGPPTSPEILGSYDYNAQGLRVRHLGSERGDVEYYYDDTAVLEEHNATDDSLLAHYRYADRLLSLTTTGGSQFYHYDGLGSTVNLSNDAGEVQVSYLLDPWGNIRSQTGTSVNRQIFTGQEYDEKTGLIYFGARYYDPDIGRFITQDSYLGVPGTPPSLHRYLYAYGNPTVYIDLYGYSPEDVEKRFNEWVASTPHERIGEFKQVGAFNKKLVRQGLPFTDKFKNRLLYLDNKGVDVTKISREDLDREYAIERDEQRGIAVATVSVLIGGVPTRGAAPKAVRTVESNSTGGIAKVPSKSAPGGAGSQVGEAELTGLQSTTKANPKLYRKMSVAEAEKTLESGLQPARKGADPTKWTSESLEKVTKFENKIVKPGTEEVVVEIEMNPQYYQKMQKNSVPQRGSKGNPQVKYHYEGLDEGGPLKNYGVTPEELQEFNLNIENVKIIKTP